MPDPVDPALIALLGARGAAALAQARGALDDAAGAPADAVLRVAAWTASEWSFRFDLADAGRALVVSVPHDGDPPVVTDAHGHPNPFIPGSG